MKVVVTGANGHIGSRIVRQLVASGHPVRGLVRAGADLRSLDGVGEGLERVVGDVLEPDSLIPLLANATLVFHTAAVFSHQLGESDGITRTAVEGTENVLRAASRVPSIERVVHTSSCAAIGNTRSCDEVRDESPQEVEDGDEVYRRAKIDSEELAFGLGRELSLPVVVVNPAVVLGPGDHRPTPSSGIIERFLVKGSPIYWNGGRSHVDVDDVAQGHILAAERGRGGERYILAGENVTIHESCRLMSDLTGLAPPRLRVGRAPLWGGGAGLEVLAKLTGTNPIATREQALAALDRFMYYDSSKAVRELGYSFRPAAEVFRRAVAWILTTELVDEPRRSTVRAHFERVVAQTPEMLI